MTTPAPGYQSGAHGVTTAVRGGGRLIVRRRLLVETAFVLGVLVKGLDGLVELVAGTALLVLHQERILALTRAAVAEELREDPHDLVAHQMVLSPGIGVVALVLLDVLILALTWHEWRVGRSFHDAWRSVVQGWFPRA